MTRIVLDLDQQTFDAVSEVARARSQSVERVIVERVAEFARSAPPNASHRAILADLDRPEGAPERGRAETYAANRRRLLALVDTADGDMGDQAWDRGSLYER